MNMCRDLTIDDFKDKLEMEGNRLDILAVVAEKGKQKLQEYAAAEEEAQGREKSSDDGEASNSTATKRRKCNSPYSEDNAPPPPLPEKFENVIREMACGKVLTPATLVIQKFLFGSDVDPNQNRFNIPICQIVRDDFLTDDEKRFLQTYFDTDIHKKQKKKKKNNNNNNNNMKKKKKKKKNNNNNNNMEKVKEKKEMRRKKYLEVKMIDPSLKLETVKFCRWDMEKTNGGKTTSNYVINGKYWSQIVTGNNLTIDMKVQLWCFRLDQELCFALVPLP